MSKINCVNQHLCQGLQLIPLFISNKVTEVNLDNAPDIVRASHSTKVLQPGLLG